MVPRLRFHGTFQEYRAERAMQALRQFAMPHATVSCGGTGGQRGT